MVYQQVMDVFIKMSGGMILIGNNHGRSSFWMRESWIGSRWCSCISSEDIDWLVDILWIEWLYKWFNKKKESG